MMSFWSRPALTTALLAVNAALLLVLVVQNSLRRPHPPMPPGMPMAASTNLPGHNHPPMDAGPAASMPPGEDFDPAGMIFASLACPENAATTLSDPSCGSSEAETRRQTVRGLMNQKLPMRGLFDQIIKTYGEGALTEQALEIRRSMRRGTP